AVVLRRGSEQAEACERDRRPAHLITLVHSPGARGRGVTRRLWWLPSTSRARHGRPGPFARPRARQAPPARATTASSRCGPLHLAACSQAATDGRLIRPLQPSKAPGQFGRTGLVSSQTGLSHSCTFPSERNTRNRSNDRANQRSWVTASTVPW